MWRVLFVLLLSCWPAAAYGQAQLPVTIRTPELTVTGSAGRATPPSQSVNLPDTIPVSSAWSRGFS
jgi:hypothetical protein